MNSQVDPKDAIPGDLCDLWVPETDSSVHSAPVDEVFFCREEDKEGNPTGMLVAHRPRGQASGGWTKRLARNWMKKTMTSVRRATVTHPIPRG